MANFEPQVAEAIKEFNARLGDELTIKPGDFIEIIADDREYNDGWYMGKNLTTNSAGLYPKSFTKPVQNPVPELHNRQSNDSSLLRSRSRNRQSLTSPLGSPLGSPNGFNTNAFQGGSTRSSVNSSKASSPNPNKYAGSSNGNISNLINTLNGPTARSSNGNKYNSFDEKPELSSSHRGSHSSVIKTMSEIDQALEDFKTSDQDASEAFSHKAIPDWTSQDVGDYFRSLDYRQEGSQFQSHKITGSILLELELSYLKELEIGPFGTRFEIFKIIESLRSKINEGSPYIATSKPKQQYPPAENLQTNTFTAQSNEYTTQSNEYTTQTNDYTKGLGEYSMDNPYLNLSSENVYNKEVHQEEVQSLNSSEFNQDSGTEHTNTSSYNINDTQTHQAPVSPKVHQRPDYDDRQFSPIRKAPLPPQQQATLANTIHSPKNKVPTEFISNSSPSTPGRSSNSIKQHYTPFSAGARVPDSPIFQTPEEEFSKLNVVDESRIESEETPGLKFRSVSANDAKGAPLPTSGNFAKRAISTSEKPSSMPALEQSESSFKVTQVRNAQTSNSQKKTKKQTSAFQEGINRVTPEIALKNADYSGWMSKKSSSAVGPWKQRFFTLHGTRLSYFGSMKDTKEKGLIDITAHRVLPAKEDDKLVSLYAATTGQGRFCFKLVPPAPGSKKGLTFTQPKVHYFAVETREEMRNWMVALMKATIDLDDSVPTVSTCSTPTVSLQKAQELLLKARENAKAREEQLKAKGFLQPGVSGFEGATKSPTLESSLDPFVGKLPPAGITQESSSLSPAESSSLNSGNSHNQSQQTNSSSNIGTPKVSTLQEISAAAIGLLSPKSPKNNDGDNSRFRQKKVF